MYASSIPTRLSALFITTAIAAGLSIASPVSAHDEAHTIAGGKVKISDPPGRSERRKFVFKTTRELGIYEVEEDLTQTASSLLVRGHGTDAGSSGIIYLLPSRWKRIGTVEATRGWKYKGDWRYMWSSGLTKVLIKKTSKGGTLLVKAKGRFWPYDVVAVQSTVEVALRLGGEQYCAEFDVFQKNLPGRVTAKDAPSPSECRTVCGNDRVELGEECDDGNLDDADTCTSTCEVGCTESSAEYDSTLGAIQALIFDSPVYQCTNEVCHGAAAQGSLDLRAETAHASLINTPSQIDPSTLRVFPGDQDRSMLYLKLAAKTHDTEGVPGSPMPTGAPALNNDLLEAVRLWIRGGAPASGVVIETAELLEACLPPASPNKIPRPAPPAFGQGVQLALPGFEVAASSETEICMPTYYDLSAPGAVPEEYRVPCPGEYPAVNEAGQGAGECFAYDRQSFAMDAQSHHLILSIYKGDYPVTDPGWGQWTCYLGPNAGQPCDPTDALACGSDGVCGGEPRTGFACITLPSFGPPDYGFRSPQFGGIQEATTVVGLGPGVYSVLPLKGIVVWNSHRFNLTSTATDLEGWVNVDFTADRTYSSRGLFDVDYLFAMDIPPFETREYCATHTFPEGAHLTDVNSHTHFWGRRYQIYGPPQTPCPKGPKDRYNYFWTTDPNCTADGAEDPFYESFNYADPLQLKLDPPMVFTGSVADRTIKSCALFDHGASNPAEVKRRSTSPEPPTPAMPGGPCEASETKCIGGPNQGALCYGDDNNCALGECDACDLLGGVTAGDEMFITFGNFYVP